MDVGDAPDMDRIMDGVIARLLAMRLGRGDVPSTPNGEAAAKGEAGLASPRSMAAERLGGSCFCQRMKLIFRTHQAQAPNAKRDHMGTRTEGECRVSKPPLVS